MYFSRPRRCGHASRCGKCGSEDRECRQKEHARRTRKVLSLLPFPAACKRGAGAAASGNRDAPAPAEVSDFFGAATAIYPWLGRRARLSSKPEPVKRMTG